MKTLWAWCASNPVAGWALTLLFLAAGLAAIPRLVVEILPDTAKPEITVSLDAPGIDAEAVAGGIVPTLEAAVSGDEAVESVESEAAAGGATLWLELRSSGDLAETAARLRSRLDRVEGLPAGVGRPVVEPVIDRAPVIDLVVRAAVDDLALQRTARTVRDRLRRHLGGGRTVLWSLRPVERILWLDDDALARTGITRDQVTAAVRAAVTVQSAGTVRSSDGRSLALSASGAGIAALGAVVVGRDRGGAPVTVDDVAAIRDSLPSDGISTRVEGEPAATITVFRSGSASALDLAAATRAFATDPAALADLPAGTSLTALNDRSQQLASRLGSMAGNAAEGFLLVLLVLLLFLPARTALYVALGIPVAFLAGLALMPWLGLSLNIVSLFAFILVLGVLIDDAVVIGESCAHHRARGLTARAASLAGVQEVAPAAMVAVATAMIAYLPLFFLSGWLGRMAYAIPVMCIALLAASLVETQLALPGHLAHAGGAPGRFSRAWNRIPQGANALLERFARLVYLPFARLVVRWRHACLGLATLVLATVAALVVSGRIPVVFLPDIQADLVAVDIAFAPGTPVSTTVAAVTRIERAGAALRTWAGATDAGQPVVGAISSTIGAQPARSAIAQRAGRTGPEAGEVIIALAPAELREGRTATPDLVRHLRGLIGDIPGATLVVGTAISQAGADLAVRLSGDEPAQLRAAAVWLGDRLRAQSGVVDIEDGVEDGGSRLAVTVSPAGRRLGLDDEDLARQVRGAFAGEELLRSITGGGEETRLVLRSRAAARPEIAAVAGLPIRLADGTPRPLAEVATLTETRVSAFVHRAEGRQVIDLSAAVPDDDGAALAHLDDVLLPDLARRFPGVSSQPAGEARERERNLDELGTGYAISLAAIWLLLAVAFRSFVQPLLLLIAIPFGVAGAVLGHAVLGLPLSLLSVCGMVAMSGVVVNDCVVFIAAINAQREAGEPLGEAVCQAGTRRLRPILLTTACTVLGLLPVVLSGVIGEEAQWLVPMAVSLGFGGLASTIAALVIIPAGYATLGDLRNLFDPVAREVNPTAGGAKAAGSQRLAAGGQRLTAGQQGTAPGSQRLASSGPPPPVASIQPANVANQPGRIQGAAPPRQDRNALSQDPKAPPIKPEDRKR